jgi:hypothetical protein
MKQQAKAKVCGDFKSIMELDVQEAVTAMHNGDEGAAATADSNATKATKDAAKLGCGWAQP